MDRPWNLALGKLRNRRKVLAKRADFIQDMISGEAILAVIRSLRRYRGGHWCTRMNFWSVIWKFIQGAGKVLMKGSEISLTPKEFDILYFLAKNRGEVFTKEQIYRAVWEEDYLLDNSNIMAFIRKLRKDWTCPDSPTYILTIWGIGYKFHCDEL